jgi:hypothetical protein
MEQARKEDEQTMRFGLATALMGDGYFGYDAGTMARGNWWWYSEYDAPLGYPKGEAQRNADGVWQREFDGGTAVVNGTLYDAVAELPRRVRDVSTGRVGARFVIPMFDGRIFVPTDAEPTPEAGGGGVPPLQPPRLTRTPPSELRLVALDEGGRAVQTPGGLELRFDTQGAIRHLLWRGERFLSGGFPAVFSPPWTAFHPQEVKAEEQAILTSVTLTFRGTLVERQQRVDFVETVTVQPEEEGPPLRRGGAGGSFTLRFDLTAQTDLNLRMWRHYFFFPVSRYAGAKATAGGQTLTLPSELAEGSLLPAARRFELETSDLRVTVDGSQEMSLVDHRRYGTPDYLLAAYPVSGPVAQGTRWSVEVRVKVEARADNA